MNDTPIDPAARHRFLNSLIHNALDFFERSVEDLESDSVKFSTIHFCQGLELFLKARLWAEHWSLAVEIGRGFSAKAVPDGKFKTVSFGMAVERIEGVLLEPIGATTKKVFEEVYQSRNRAVHFFHTDLQVSRQEPKAASRGKNRKLGLKRKDAAALHVLAWYELNHLLTTTWEGPFRNWTEQIQRLDRRMEDLPSFLKPSFDGFVKQGLIDANARRCPACDFKSLRTEEIGESLKREHCPVCRLDVLALYLKCPDCSDCGSFRWALITNGSVAA